jgi:integrase
VFATGAPLQSSQASRFFRWPPGIDSLRWRDIDEQARLLTVREAVYHGVFSTPKTEAGARRIPLSDTALRLIAEWKAHVEDVKPDALMFSTSAGTTILPNNVVRR